MKKFVLLSAMLMTMMGMKAQFVEYKPVYVNPPTQHNSVPSYRMELPQVPQPEENFVDIGAYYIKNNQFVRIKVRVKETIYSGRSSLTVVGYYSGPLNSLIKTYGQVSKVIKLYDGEVVANNFEWKSNIASYGTIYFNL